MSDSHPQTSGRGIPEEIMTFHLNKAAELGIPLTREKLSIWLTRPFFQSLMAHKYDGAASPFDDMWDEWCYWQVVYWQAEQASDNAMLEDFASSINVWDILLAEQGIY